MVRKQSAMQSTAHTHGRINGWYDLVLQVAEDPAGVLARETKPLRCLFTEAKALADLMRSNTLLSELDDDCDVLVGDGGADSLVRVREQAANQQDQSLDLLLTLGVLKGVLDTTADIDADLASLVVSTLQRSRKRNWKTRLRHLGHASIGDGLRITVAQGGTDLVAGLAILDHLDNERDILVSQVLADRAEWWRENAAPGEHVLKDLLLAACPDSNSFL